MSVEDSRYQFCVFVTEATGKEKNPTSPVIRVATVRKASQTVKIKSAVRGVACLFEVSECMCDVVESCLRYCCDFFFLYFEPCHFSALTLMKQTVELKWSCGFVLKQSCKKLLFHRAL